LLGPGHQGNLGHGRIGASDAGDHRIGHVLEPRTAAQVEAALASYLPASPNRRIRPCRRPRLLTVALVGFLDNRNGDFPEFGEATSTNVGMGAAGLATAFAGGAVLFLGKRKANQSTSLNFGSRGVSVSRRLSW